MLDYETVKEITGEVSSSTVFLYPLKPQHTFHIIHIRLAHR